MLIARFSLSIEVGRHFSRDQLLEEAKRLRDAERESAIFESALGNKSEVEISLADPHSKKKVQTPVRGRRCEHARVSRGS